ncbi:MAG TPA: hypothetical protein DD641_08025 [Deltaproteobacteria bacterium]|nr:MAG: hypothetical protein A2Z09_05385 [Nitrospirae bacterium RBG_16_43_8]HBO84901.1 hypothetical protein [Deltaproteobacteria bacterium]
MLKNKGGFTLIELIMIIIILGILAAVALPKYQDLATEAKQGVVDGTAGAFKSAAVISFAKNRGVKSGFASILSQITYENVSITVSGDCSTLNAVTVSYPGSTATKTVDVSEYCSGA